MVRKLATAPYSLTWRHDIAAGHGTRPALAVEALAVARGHGGRRCSMLPFLPLLGALCHLFRRDRSRGKSSTRLRVFVPDLRAVL